LSGTGSCCFGRRPDGRTAKVGGWGHILGDKGSGFEIGLRALKAVVYYFDRDGEWSQLGQRILRALQLNEPDDLIGWVQRAAKDEIAAVAIEVFKARARRDSIVSDILKGAASSLARDAAACAKRLAPEKAEVQFVLAGSVLLKQPRFAQAVGRELKRCWPKAIITPLREDGAIGATRLAEKHFPASKLVEVIDHAVVMNTAATPGDLKFIARSPTEQRHPLSMNLDKMSLEAAITLMLGEDRKVTTALLAERGRIESGVKLIVNSFRKGGRLFYIGAGTSGRLGVLDASECPPTFQSDPEMVQGIIAGGQRALWEAVEGAEDDTDAGARAMQFRGVTRRDTVVGIAASGRTPFVWGALREAKRRGASTMLLCFNSNLVIPRADRPTLLITPRIGPEILTGSTRLKAGTATKLVLNIFTTLAMVRMGKVLGNLMIDVKASNAKLRDRATRIVQELTGADYGTTRAALEKTKWQIKPACARLRRR
jgi:N-acetylmuramic acid 6-phosphate etherase